MSDEVVRDAARITASIGYMSQAYSLYEDLTVGENLRHFAALRGVRGPVLDERLARLLEHHQAAMRQRLLLGNHRLSLQIRSLDTLNPSKILARGYATVSKGASLVTSVTQLSTGDRVSIRLADGSADAEIT